MIKIVFATHNPHKLREVAALTPPFIELVGLYQIGCNEDIPETATTLEGNALLKAKYVYENYNLNCFADDTGLEVEALGGMPGVYSARYAGDAKDSNANIEKLLKELQGQSNRKARFKTVIYMIRDGKEIMFEGLVNGTIATEKHGVEGFGYDPVFIPCGYSKSFAQMPLSEKNEISHRALAFDKLAKYLQGIQ